MDARAPNPSTRDGHMTFGRDVASSFVDPNDPRAVSRVVEDALTSTSTVEAGDFVAIDELRRLLLEMEDQLMLDSQQRSWEHCRDHWRRRVRLLHFSDPDLPRSLSKILLGATPTAFGSSRVFFFGKPRLTRVPSPLPQTWRPPSRSSRSTTLGSTSIAASGSAA